MKTALLLALLSVAFVGCESADAIAQAAAKAAKAEEASGSYSSFKSASAKGRYEFKDGVLTFKDALYAELYDENGEDCSIEVEAGHAVTIKEVSEEKILFTNNDPQFPDIPFYRMRGSVLDDSNLLLGTFGLEFESDTTNSYEQFKFDGEFVEVTMKCSAK